MHKLCTKKEFESHWLPLKGKVIWILHGMSCSSEEIGIVTEINRSYLILKRKPYTTGIYLSDIMAIGPSTRKEFEKENDKLYCLNCRKSRHFSEGHCKKCGADVIGDLNGNFRGRKNE